MIKQLEKYRHVWSANFPNTVMQFNEFLIRHSLHAAWFLYFTGHIFSIQWPYDPQRDLDPCAHLHITLNLAKFCGNCVRNSSRKPVDDHLLTHKHTQTWDLRNLPKLKVEGIR